MSDYYVILSNSLFVPTAKVSMLEQRLSLSSRATGLWLWGEELAELPEFSYLKQTGLFELVAEPRFNSLITDWLQAHPEMFSLLQAKIETMDIPDGWVGWQNLIQDFVQPYARNDWFNFSFDKQRNIVGIEITADRSFDLNWLEGMVGFATEGSYIYFANERYRDRLLIQYKESQMLVSFVYKLNWLSLNEQQQDLLKFYRVSKIDSFYEVLACCTEKEYIIIIPGELDAFGARTKGDGAAERLASRYNINPVS